MCYLKTFLGKFSIEAQGQTPYTSHIHPYLNIPVSFLCSILRKMKPFTAHRNTLIYKWIIHLVRTQNFPKSKDFSPLDTHTCADQGVRNVGFSENYATH